MDQPTSVTAPPWTVRSFCSSSYPASFALKLSIFDNLFGPVSVKGLNNCNVFAIVEAAVALGVGHSGRYCRTAARECSIQRI